MVAQIEKEHEERYRELAENLKNNKVFARRGAAGMAVPELRLHLYRQVRTAQVPGVRTSAELL